MEDPADKKEPFPTDAAASTQTPIMGKLIEDPIIGRVVDEPAPEETQVEWLSPTTESQTEGIPEQAGEPPAQPPGERRDQPGPRPGLIRRCFALVMRCIWTLFCIASLVVLLAVVTAIPIVQLIAFGYLLDVAGRLTAGGKLREALPNLNRAGIIGMTVLAVLIAALPAQLLVHWESVAQLINPDSEQAAMLRFLAIGFSVFVMGYLMWAWARGGRLRHYLWPQPVRFLREGWRPSTWSGLPDQLWDFTAALELPRLFSLGLRGALGTLIWLIPAMLIAAMIENGTNGLAGLVGFLSLLALGLVLLYLPMLQAHFAAENRFSALFEVKEIRSCFRRAPWAWLIAMIFGLVVLPIPLYLLKVEATPQEVVWLPCLVFVAFMLPARIGEGLALRRARRREEQTGWWAMFSRWTVRILMLAVVGIYLVFLTVSQYTSWDGLGTWVQQHAILLPIPFLGGT